MIPLWCIFAENKSNFFFDNNQSDFLNNYLLTTDFFDNSPNAIIYYKSSFNTSWFGFLK